MIWVKPLSVPKSTCCVILLQACLTLCNTMDCSLPGSSVHGILQARILEWVTTTSTRGSKLCLLCLLHWQVGSLPLVPPGKPSRQTLNTVECMHAERESDPRSQENQSLSWADSWASRVSRCHKECSFCGRIIKKIKNLPTFQVLGKKGALSGRNFFN